ncbi:MAG: Na+/H+ antiporter NhaA [Cypionkella sp.]
MYRVSPSVRHFALSLVAGVVVATLWANLASDSYYDFIEWRLMDLSMPAWVSPITASLTPASLTSHVLMAFFMFVIGKELWEAVTLEHGAFSGRQAALPLSGMLGALIGAALVWVLVGSMIERAEEASFAVGWQVPLGSDVVLCYLFGRRAFGPGHPALQLLLLVTIGCDFIGLAVLGLSYPRGGLLSLAWLALPLVASAAVWLLFGRFGRPNLPERQHRRAQQLWPYILAGALSFLGVAAAGLPPALGFLPVIPAIPSALRAFGLFADAEHLLHDPLNRLEQLLTRPLAVVLFLFGLTRGGIDLGAYAPTTLTLLAAFWIGKPLGFLAGCALLRRYSAQPLPQGVRPRDLQIVALLLGIGFTVPVLALDTALPGGGMAEAARLGAGITVLIGALALAYAKLRRR